MSDLKPCPNPWCESDPDVYVFAKQGKMYTEVHCRDCGVHSPCSTDADRAIEIWNTRKDIADELAEALGNIAKQQLESEMDESNGRDFQYAYREMILVARAAIAKYKERKG